MVRNDQSSLREHINQSWLKILMKKIYVNILGNMQELNYF